MSKQNISSRYISNESKSDVNEGLRLRVSKSRNTDVLPKHYGGNKETYKVPLPLSYTVFLAVCYILVIVYIIIIEMEKRLPTPLMIEDEPNNVGRFISERAQNHVLNLTSLGPRPTGSFENEVLAVNFLSREINSIITRSKKVHRVSMDIQRTSGAFPLKFLDGMTNVYRNVQNVIVKIGPLESSQHSLLLNCHFDTVADSPGGSDDGASCAIMLEILRIISQSEKPLVHNIIFLFNGAEENLMQASHGFITQHRWAKEIRAFINLEACGAGGREILFQAGPQHPWIMEAYSESVPFPLASSLAQEIFQSGLIPGDTDFRIFRDFGNLAGLDFAWSSNGYVYHTRLDNAAQIPLGTLQRTGDNILALTQKLVSATQMFNVSAHKKGNLMFFDFLGAFIIRWTDFVAMLVNMAIILLSLYTVHWNLKDSVAQGLSKQVYLQQLVISAGAVLASWIVPLFTTALIALTLSKLDRAMSWFSRPAWLLFLYIIPALLVSMSVILLVAKKQKIRVHSPWLLFRIYYDAGQIIFTITVLVSTVFTILSGYIPAMWILFSSFGNILKERIFKKVKDWRWLGIHTLVFLLPFIQCGYTANGALLLIIPIMGRAGSGNHAELVLSLITCAIFLLLLSFLVPVILLVRNMKRVLSFLVGVFLVAVLTLVLTPLGFPYSSDALSPCPQRFVIMHVDNTFYNINGEVRKHDSGLWIVDLDVNSPHSVKALVPEMAQARLVEDCESELYCGLPYLIPVSTFLWQTHWISGPPPVISVKTELNLVNIEERDNNISRLTFSVVGPDHMSVVLSPHEGLELTRWSLLPDKPLAGPKWNGRNTYFIYYSYGSDPEPWIFWMDIEKSPGYNGSLVDINLTGHFVHGAHQTTVRLRRFLSQFPPWTVTSGWTAVLKSYVF